MELSIEEEAYREQKVRELLEESVRQMERNTPVALDRAQAALELATTIKEKDVRVLDGLGCVSWRRGRPVESKQYFRKAIELDPYYSRP